MSQTTITQQQAPVISASRPHSLRHDYPLLDGQTRLSNRAVSFILFISCAALLGVSMKLNPDPSGMGTHEQLGLPACGFLALTHLPCATCGMTTAFAHAAHGHVLASLYAQPAGAVLAVMTAVTLLISLYAMITGISLLPLGRLLCKPMPLIAMGSFILLAWAFKVLCVYGVF